MQESSIFSQSKTSSQLICNHEIKSRDTQVQKITFCRKCAYSKYNNIFLINHKVTSNNYDYRITPNVSKVSQNTNSSKMYGYIGGTSLREKKFRTKLIEQSLIRTKALCLDEESFY